MYKHDILEKKNNIFTIKKFEITTNILVKN